MTYRVRCAWILALLAATLASASAVQAQVANKTTGGTLDFQVISGTGFDKSKVLPVVFVWHPEPEPEEASFQVTAECRRRSRLSGPPNGTNRLLFDLRMTPIGSGKEYKLGRRRRKLDTTGRQTKVADWTNSELGAIAAEGLVEGILVRFEISLRRGGLGFGETVSCECRVTETGPRGIAISTGAEAAPVGYH